MPTTRSCIRRRTGAIADGDGAENGLSYPRRSSAQQVQGMEEQISPRPVIIPERFSKGTWDEFRLCFERVATINKWDDETKALYLGVFSLGGQS